MIEKEWCETRCDGRRHIVPAPSKAEAERVLHADVANDASHNFLYAQVLHGFRQSLEVLVTESGVETTHHAEVAIEHCLLNVSMTECLCAELVVFAQKVEGSDGRE